MNVYDYPEFLDLTFQEETGPEADFVEAACEKYGRQPTRLVLEPGCGGGRLVVELAERGYEVLGFDSSGHALEHLERQLIRRRQAAELFAADLASFRVPRPVDAAVCTFNTFRHLLSEADAVSHLRCVARSLRSGGIYILGFHLLPLDVDEHCIERWSGARGQTRVSVTLRILASDRRQRIEHMRLSLLARHGKKTVRVRSDYPLRMYTAAQFRQLLRKVPEFELCDVYDFWYDISEPLEFNDDITDTVFILRRRSGGRGAVYKPRR